MHVSRIHTRKLKLSAQQCKNAGPQELIIDHYLLILRQLFTWIFGDLYFGLDL